jgi:hypothetical protein
MGSDGNGEWMIGCSSKWIVFTIVLLVYSMPVCISSLLVFCMFKLVCISSACISRSLVLCMFS